jgi:ATP-dependent RNA helicase DDX49/DBP8
MASACGDGAEKVPETFKALGVAPWLVGTLAALGIRRPTPVQVACIPPALAGRDVVGAAETGTGKTAAFAVPILQALAPDPCGVFAVVLTPTRELAFQIAQTFRAIGASIALRAEVLVGGVDELSQAAALARRPHVVIATPGRLALLLRREDGSAGVLSRVRYLVVDEADRMLEAEYLPDLGVVLDAASASDRQTMLFSATMTPSMDRLHELVLQSTSAFRFDANTLNPFATLAALKQQYVFMPVNLKETHLVHMLKVARPNDTVIVFAARCDTAEHLTTMLQVLGMRRVASMHSDMPQTQRIAALQSLKQGTVRALVATDVASRGLDIPDVDLVINYDLPRKTSTYVHRVGRTARAGKKGLAVSFITQTDVELAHAIEERLERKLEKFAGQDDKAVMDELSTTLKARQIAQLEITDNGFMARYDSRRADGRAAAKKRKRTEQRKVERARRRQRVAEGRAKG